MISVVSPVYMGENLVEELVSQLIMTLDTIGEDYEIILVDDSSPDMSWEKIESLCKIDHRIKGIKFSRNFGQHYAITAGLKISQGDWIVVMDCDLQDRPDQIPLLYEKAIEGYDLVLAQRKQRQDSLLKRTTSKLFYKILAYLTNTEQDPTIANFGVYHRKVVDAILEMKDHIRFLPTMSQWVGFKKTKLEVLHSKRFEGTSSYSYKKLLDLAVNNIIAFSDKPLRLTIKLGFFISIVSFVFALFYLLLYLTNNIKVPGFTSLMLSIWFLSGIIIIILGVLGLYVGKIFDKVKNRPVYIVEESLNI
jgi:dolichol-phosphate mannosyltransferase